MFWVFPAASSTSSRKYYPAFCHISMRVAPNCGKFIYQITHFLAIKNQVKLVKRWFQERSSRKLQQTPFIFLVSVCHLPLILTKTHSLFCTLLKEQTANNHQSHLGSLSALLTGLRTARKYTHDNLSWSHCYAFNITVSLQSKLLVFLLFKW